MKQPAVEASKAIVCTMIRGSSKDGCDESWRDKPTHYHLTKAIRHATTALMMELGDTPQDGENHLELAITRLSMALSLNR